MTAKRFYYAHGIIFDTHKDNHVNKIGTIKDLDTGLRIVDWLNVLHEENEQLKEEKEKWKSNCSLAVSENSILWNEISILCEQGAEPSEAFNDYLNKKRGDLND